MSKKFSLILIVMIKIGTTILTCSITNVKRNIFSLCTIEEHIGNKIGSGSGFYSCQSDPDQLIRNPCTERYMCLSLSFSLPFSLFIVLWLGKANYYVGLSSPMVHLCILDGISEHAAQTGWKIFSEKISDFILLSV